MQSRISLDTPIHTQTSSKKRAPSLVNMHHVSRLMDTPLSTQLLNERSYHLATHGFQLNSGHGTLVEGHAKTVTLFAPVVLKYAHQKETAAPNSPKTALKSYKRLNRKAFSHGVAIDPNHPLPHIAHAR